MPIWILVVLLPLGNPHSYLGEVMDYFDTKRSCLQSQSELDQTDLQTACVELR